MTNAWKSLEQLTPEVIEGKSMYVIHVDTRDMHFNLSEKGWSLPEICPCNPTKRAKPMTLEQVKDRLKEWDDNGFSWLHYSKEDKRCHLNSIFKYVRIVWTDKGLIWCYSSRGEDSKYIAVPEETIKKYVEFNYPYSNKKRITQ
jgi:hypothetical protein